MQDTRKLESLFQKYTEAFQKILFKKIRDIRKNYLEHFKNSPDKPFIVIQTELRELMKIVTDIKTDDFSSIEEVIVYKDTKEASNMGISSEQEKMINHFKDDVRIHHVITYKVKEGTVLKFNRTYLLYDPEDAGSSSGSSSDSRSSNTNEPNKIFKYNINPQIYQSLKDDKVKRSEWMDGLREKIKKDFKKTSFTFPESIEEWFKEFVEEFKYEKRSFIIEESMVVLWDNNV